MSQQYEPGYDPDHYGDAEKHEQQEWHDRQIDQLWKLDHISRCDLCRRWTELIGKPARCPECEITEEN